MFESLRPDHRNKTESQIPTRCLAFLFSAHFSFWWRPLVAVLLSTVEKRPSKPFMAVT